MKTITENTKELQDAIFKILKRWDFIERGWWYGYDSLYDQLYTNYGIDVGQFHVKVLKEALQSLKAEGKVFTHPIFNMDGKTNGSGWFYNYYK